jgi:EmrB/QacA subfamily drug resistance transporter
MTNRAPATSDESVRAPEPDPSHTATADGEELIGGRTHRQIMVIFGALMLGMLLAALDQTIVSTALPVIVGQFHSLNRLSWVVSAYLVASTVTTPLYGKISDLYGRKPVFLSAIAVFLVGSVFTGLAQNMTELIAFRFVQGAGAGGLMTLAMTIIADIIPPRHRGRYQGYLGSVFMLSSVIGPFLGGFITQHFSWRWIFYINIPLGVVALFMISAVLHLPRHRVQHRIDWTGATLLTGGVACLLLALTWGGTEYAWGSATILSLFAGAVAALAAFLFVEQRASEPIIPLRLFRNRTVAFGTAASAVVGLAMFAAIIYMPLFLQVVRGMSPTNSGFQLTPLMVGLIITTVIIGRRITKTGHYRFYPVFGSAVMAGSMALLSTMSPSTPTWVTFAYMAVLGAGIGACMQVLILAVQNAVEPADLGTATGLSSFLRSLGGVFGVALGGTILTNRLAHNLAPLKAKFAAATKAAAAHGSATGAKPAHPLDLSALHGKPAAIHHLPAVIRIPVVHAFANSLDTVFLVGVPVVIVALVVCLGIREVPLREGADHAAPEPAV